MSQRRLGSRSRLQPGIQPSPILATLGGAVVLLSVLLLAATPGSALAADPGRTITLGESNTAAQREELLAYFQAGEDDRVLDVTLADTQRAMDGIYDVSDISSAYSSTALTCRSAGTGVEVETRNIEVVPPALYAMALATAGIDDATLVVAAPDDAPAEGMTALTGVFQTWDLAPCGGATLDRERQELALEELALAVQIGRELGADGGVQEATDLLLATQQAVIVDQPRDREAVDEVVAAQERATGVTVPAAQRDDLVELMTRLAGQRIDWGSFGNGWSLEQGDDDSRVTLTALAVGGPTGSVDPTPTITPTAAATVTPTAGTVSGPVDGTGGTTSSGRRWPLGLAGALGSLALLALLVGGLLMVLRRRRRRSPMITFTPRSRPALASAVRLRVVGPATRLQSRSWYRSRQRPGHPDGTTV